MKVLEGYGRGQVWKVARHVTPEVERACTEHSTRQDELREAWAESPGPRH